MKQRSCALIKPDAVRAKNSGKIIDVIEHNGFDIIGMQKIHLTPAQAEAFYAIHKDRSFFRELVDFMTSGPIIAMALEKENAVAEWRHLMGDTNPATAQEGTIRKRFGASIGENATHGSDSAENAKTEIAFFFPNL